MKDMNNNNNHRQNGYNRNPQGGQAPRGQYNGQYQYRQQNPQGNAYPPVRHKSRTQVRRAAILAVLCAVIFLLLAATAVIFVGRILSGRIGDGETTNIQNDVGDIQDSGTGTGDEPGADSGDIPNGSDTQPLVTDPPETQLADTYEYIEMSEADIHKGYQILVNYQNEYTFDAGFNIKPFYGNKNLSYKVRDTLVSFDSHAMKWCNQMMEAMEADLGNNFVLVNSSYRTLEEQEAIYASYLDKYGEEYAQLYVAVPGYSEHHTGLAVDFTVYTDDGEAYKFDDKTEYPEWLTGNGYKYGFIQRYPADKTDITKIAYENWHYRYVGKPHAFYVVKNNLCYEEYIDLLRDFEFGDKHLQITDDEGASWEIYFVPASITGTTKVPVPKYANYEISGNNVDGFIVTCGG